mgnify:CR=1 FL=1
MKKALVLLAVFFAIVAVSGALADTTFVCGDVSGVWDSSGSPFCVVCDVRVPPGSTLVIGPGVDVIFMSEFGFTVDTNAVLKAIGNASDSIIFTSRDTTLRHDGIMLYSSADGCTLSYCRVENGGSGIRCSYSSPAIINNTISGNSGDEHYGGGIYCHNSNPTITGNIISGNSGTYNGGGIYCGGSNPTIRNNTISGNSVFGHGGGIYCEYSSNPIITNNTISGNSASLGGGIHCHNSNPTITNNTISGNSADDNGGGIYCDYSSNIYMSNDIILGNTAGFSGGGIWFDGDSVLTIVNSTITENAATDSVGGGICLEDNSSLTLINTIVWNNTAPTGEDISVNYSFGDPCTVFAAFCDIDPAMCFVQFGSAIVWDTGNIDANPFFADTLFHLSDSSSCIDAGAESVYVSLWDTTIYAPLDDFEGGIRPFGSGWDIGADEYGADIVREHPREMPQTISITAYPNPFNSVVTISVGAIHELPLQIEIFDINGRIVYEMPVGEGLVPSRVSGDHKGRHHETAIWRPDGSIGSGVFLARIRGTNTAKKIIYMK